MAHRLPFRTCPLLLLLLGLAAAPLPCAPVQGPGHRFQVAVLPPELDSNNGTVARNADRLIQERLQDALFQQGDFDVVERTDPAILESILAELRFQNDGLVAPQDTRNLGKLAGIEVFISAAGELRVGLLGCTLSLRVRLIDVETSKLVGLFQVHGKGRARLDPNRSMREAVGAAMDDLAGQLRGFHLEASQAK